MAKQFPRISSDIQAFIKEQKMFFVATAMQKGLINVSPKGMDSFRIMDENRIIWMNLTGSGNETAAHLLESNRMTIMFCSFEKKPLILRLYGTAKVYHERDPLFGQLLGEFPNSPGVRQIIDLQVDMVQTSCGYAVPFMDFKEERTQLNAWATKQGKERILKYWKEKNTTSLDGHPTNIFGSE